MREDLIERLRRKADSTVESPAPHLTGDMKFYVYDAETRDLLTEAAAALEAAREGARRWGAIREMDGGAIYSLLGDCDGIHPEHADAAIDAARKEARNG